MAEVTIYTTHTCPYCKMEKEYLDEKGIKYKNVFVDDDPEQAQKMMELSGQLGVPFTLIKKDDGAEEKILGFDKGRLDSALGI